MLLTEAGIARESLVDRGLDFARRRSAQGRFYFISNSSAADIDGWVPLAGTAGRVVAHDPMRGGSVAAPIRPAAGGGLEVHVELPAGESIILSTHAAAAGEPVPPAAIAGASVAIEGPWALRFVAGGPTIPAERTLDRLASWTTFGGEDLKAFSGTAMYSTRFPRPRERASLWRLDLGRVHESAHVRLNGIDVETLIGPRFSVAVTDEQLRASNLLEVRVTNLMANRIAALDRAGVPWKTFYNVNFPSRLPENRGPGRALHCSAMGAAIFGSAGSRHPHATAEQRFGRQATLKGCLHIAAMDRELCGGNPLRAHNKTFRTRL